MRDRDRKKPTPASTPPAATPPQRLDTLGRRISPIKRGADLCVANCYLLPGSTIRPHTRSAQKHMRNRKRPD